MPHASRTAITLPSRLSRAPPRGARAAAAIRAGQGKVARTGANGGEASVTSFKVRRPRLAAEGADGIPSPDLSARLEARRRREYLPLHMYAPAPMRPLPTRPR